MSFQGHLKILENENFRSKLIKLLEISEFLLFSSFAALNSIKNNFKKYPKESGTRKLMIHACAVNVTLELLESLCFGP